MPSIADIVTTSRPSQATYFDANGVLRTAAANVWRRDHDPVTKQPLGLLVEPQGTNFVRQSQNLTASPWVRDGGYLNSVEIDDPRFGKMLKIRRAANSGTSRLYQAGIAPPSSGIAIMSFVMKRLDLASDTYLQIGNASSGPTWGANLTLASGEFGGPRSNTISYGKIDLGDGYEKYWYTGDLAATSADLFLIRELGSIPIVDTDRFLFGTPQLEIREVSSSFIATGAAATTRAADNISFPLPAGVHDVTYTFDDDSTLVAPGVSGTYTIPTNLPRRHIKSIVARAA